MTKVCFMISPIGEPNSATRSHADKVKRHIIQPAVEPFGYEVIRADQIEESGIITAQIIQKILEVPLVVADLTDRNPNVFYELCLRHASRKPFVQVISTGQQIPFDIIGQRTISYDVADLDSVEQARQSIRAQVEKFEANPAEVDSPVSVAIDLVRLRGSTDPTNRSIVDVLDGLHALSLNVGKLEKALANNSMELAARIEAQTQRFVENLYERTRPKTRTRPAIDAAYYSEVAELHTEIVNMMTALKSRGSLADLLSRLSPSLSACLKIAEELHENTLPF
jgi:hypothetical protein